MEDFFEITFNYKGQTYDGRVWIEPEDYYQVTYHLSGLPDQSEFLFLNPDLRVKKLADHAPVTDSFVAVVVEQIKLHA